MAHRLPSDCAFELAGRIVHIWAVRTQCSDAVVAEFQQVLSHDERERAARIRIRHTRRSFIVAKGAVRILLGRYLNVEANGIRFRYGLNGKPSLSDPSSIRFNASHSGNLAIFAFTLDCEIGVDVEQIRPLSDMHDIAARFFCQEEAMELMSLPESRRELAFFLCWTRKEAYIKATGEGLSASLDDFRVTLRPDDPARFVHVRHDTSAGWTLHDVKLPGSYTAALAYRDTPRVIHVFPVIDAADFPALASGGLSSWRTDAG